MIETFATFRDKELATSRRQTMMARERAMMATSGAAKREAAAELNYWLARTASIVNG